MKKVLMEGFEKQTTTTQTTHGASLTCVEGEGALMPTDGAGFEFRTNQ